jgi:hypothetical protein
VNSTGIPRSKRGPLSYAELARDLPRVHAPAMDAAVRAGGISILPSVRPRLTVLLIEAFAQENRTVPGRQILQFSKRDITELSVKGCRLEAERGNLRTDASSLPRFRFC